MANKLAYALSSLLTLTAAAAAQNCSDNTYRIRLVDGTGAELPTSTAGYLPPNEMVYMAFDAALPSGIYYVHVTDPIGGHDEVLSMNQGADRFVQITNNAGVISLSLPYSVNPDVPAFGVGYGGVGQSLPLFPFRSASWDPCHFKAWLGDSWTDPVDPTWPYPLGGGYDATRGVCRIRSYVSFDIGDGTGSDVTGFVFDDTDRNGALDDGEQGLSGEEVRLVGTAGTLTVLTEADGTFRFVDVSAGDYSVEITVGSGSVATNATSQTIKVCGCADVAVTGFGKAQECLPANGHTIGYWRNCHGLARISQGNLLPQLNALPLVNGYGRRVCFANTAQFACWLQGANSTNMAYMLSAQLAAMFLNVATGLVDERARLTDDELGTMTAGELMAMAMASLAADGYTPRCDANRDAQERLKCALDGGNNNRTWIDRCASNEPPPVCTPRPHCGPKPQKPRCGHRPRWGCR